MLRIFPSLSHEGTNKKLVSAQSVQRRSVDRSLFTHLDSNKRGEKTRLYISRYFGRTGRLVQTKYARIIAPGCHRCRSERHIVSEIGVGSAEAVKERRIGGLK